MSNDGLEEKKGSLDRLSHLAKVLTDQRLDADMSRHSLQSLSPVALAYLGDAVFELFVRGALLIPPKRIRAYHRQVVDQVRAEQQAHHLQQILPQLTEAEQNVLRRGRNASPRGPKRLDGQTYQQATGFETLIGYLYLTNLDRLVELLDQLNVTAPKQNPPGS